MTFSASVKTTVKTAVAGAGLAAAAIFTATSAAAAPSAPFGTMEQFNAADYTVSDLQPSGNGDGVWFADVTVHAGSAAVTPRVGEFNAVGPNGATYTAILGDNPDGLPAGPIAPGQSASGRVYFDVNGGPQPDSVVFSTNDDPAQSPQLIWKG